MLSYVSSTAQNIGRTTFDVPGYEKPRLNLHCLTSCSNYNKGRPGHIDDIKIYKYVARDKESRSV